MRSVSLVIPTYNEAKNLPLLVAEIFERLDAAQTDLELIIVDDNSPDGTGAVAEELASKYPIKVLHRSGKLGLGSAVIAGFKASARPYLGVMDADLSHDPVILNEMLAALDTHDIAIGSRFEAASTVESWVWWRKLLSHIGVGLTRALTGVRDPLSGYFFLRRGVIENIDLTTTGYKILLEILVKGAYARVKEFSYNFRIRKFSTSKLEAKEYWLFLQQIVVYSWHTVRKKCWLSDAVGWIAARRAMVAIILLTAVLLTINSRYRTFWGDETAVLEYLSQSPWEFIKSYWFWPDNHPPLYYFAVLLISKVLPWNEFTIRLVSICSGLGIVALVYRFMLRVSRDRSAALLAAFFTAFSSYFVLISQMARYHSFAGFSALLAFYLFYRLYSEGFSARLWYAYLSALVLTSYVDYPHGMYVILLTNLFYLYRLARRRPIASFGRWIAGQLGAAVLCLPLVWMLYHRIAIQGDGGFHNTNLLSNSLGHIFGGIFFHIYAFFFGENLFPWNYAAFAAGSVVLLGVAAGLVQAMRRKAWALPQVFIVGLSITLIVLNTIFMNYADRRYNFIVYPKFGFVAYPFCIMSFVLCLWVLRSRKVKTALFILWAFVGLSGLVHFYRLENYLNASYFRTFASFEYVRDHAKSGEYLAMTPDASPGVYRFYHEKYFSKLTPLSWRDFQSSTVPKGAGVWLFATASDANEGSVETDNLIPPGYRITSRFDAVPLDPKFKQFKERVLHRPSYTYKYSVFLLEKI